MANRPVQPGEAFFSPSVLGLCCFALFFPCVVPLRSPGRCLAAGFRSRDVGLWNIVPAWRLPAWVLAFFVPAANLWLHSMSRLNLAGLAPASLSGPPAAFYLNFCPSVTTQSVTGPVLVRLCLANVWRKAGEHWKKSERLARAETYRKYATLNATLLGSEADRETREIFLKGVRHNFRPVLFPPNYRSPFLAAIPIALEVKPHHEDSFRSNIVDRSCG